MLSKNFNPVNKILGKKLNTIRLLPGKSRNDWDGDGILNKRDCQPFNIMRQDRLNLLMPEKKTKAEELREKQRRVDAWDMQQGRMEKPTVIATQAGFNKLPQQQKQWTRFETPDSNVVYGKQRIPSNEEIDAWILNGGDDIFMQQEGVPISKIEARRRALSLKRIANRRW